MKRQAPLRQPPTDKLGIGGPPAGADSVMIRSVERVSRLLDSQFRIPGTSLRFGFDFLLGLLPGAGDLVSMAISGLLIAHMVRHGVRGRLLARMLINVALDTIVGSIPVVGNVFDFFYKANNRNLQLLRAARGEPTTGKPIWPWLLAVVLVLLAAAVATVVVTIAALSWWLA